MPTSDDTIRIFAIAHNGTQRRVPKGMRVFGPGQTSGAMLMLVGGTLRVEHHACDMRTRLLFRVHGGDGCILSNACPVWRAYPTAKAIAETDLDLLSLPRPAFDELMVTSARFRGLIFRANAAQILNLLRAREATSLPKNCGSDRV